MSQLIKISAWSGPLRENVIFVHGLGGNAYSTWKGSQADNFWPLWLGRDVEGLSVYTLSYEAPPTDWLGASMPLQDRVVNVLETLLAEPALRNGPIAFICHSLGGLIVKQLLLDLHQQKNRRPEAEDLLSRVTQIVFAATPHTGSPQATLLDRISFVALPTALTRTLVANDPALRAINVAYRGLAEERRDVLKHRIFYETYGTPAGIIVDEASADPGLPGDPPTPIDADHISIVKPVDRASILYVRTRDFIERTPLPPLPEGAPARRFETFPLPAIRSEAPRDIVPKLIRLAAIVGFVSLLGLGLREVIAPEAPVSHAEFKTINEKVDRILAAFPVGGAAISQLPPGEKAFAETIASSARAAKAGDARKRQALELLEAGKVKEAEEIYRQIAAEKISAATEQRAAARKHDQEAAAAFRDVGAVSALHDARRARDAFAKAVELDPEDRTGLVMNGWLQLLTHNLLGAEKSFNALLSLKSGGIDELDRTSALLGLGRVAQSKGDSESALKLYRQAEKETQHYRESNRADPEKLRHYADIADVATELSSGDALFALQRYDEARQSYDAGAAVVARRLKKEPEEPVWLALRASFLGSIGGVLMKQDKPDEALKYFESALTTIDAPSKMQSISQVTRDGQLSWQKSIGDILSRQQKWADAQNHYEAAVGLAEQLTVEDPSNVDWQDKLATLYEDMAETLAAQQKWDEATGYGRDALSTAKRLAAANPNNFDLQLALARANMGMAMIYVRAARVKEGEDAIESGRRLVEQLSAAHPENATLGSLVQQFKMLAEIEKKWARENSVRAEPRSNARKKQNRR